MKELGQKSEFFGTLKQLSINGRPSYMPDVGPEEVVICGYDQGLGERMIVCESLDDMQKLYDNCRIGLALQITWYSGSIIMLILRTHDDKHDESGSKTKE